MRLQFSVFRANLPTLTCDYKLWGTRRILQGVTPPTSKPYSGEKLHHNLDIWEFRTFIFTEFVKKESFKLRNQC